MPVGLRGTHLDGGGILGNIYQQAFIRRLIHCRFLTMRVLRIPIMLQYFHQSNTFMLKEPQLQLQSRQSHHYPPPQIYKHPIVAC